jgi:UDP-N-acetylglucosamine 3-dehydrogenase
MRIGILGAGSMGSTHARAYATMQDVQIAGIVGRHKARVQKLASSLGVAALTDPRSILDDATVDAVDVCYPSFVHREYTVAALQRGKHVLCEVPMALTLEDTGAMLAAAHASGKLLCVAFVVRFVDAQAYVRERVLAGDLGRPQLASLTYLYPTNPEWLRRSAGEFGGLLLELLPHQIDYVNWLLGRPAAVSATGLCRPDGELAHAFLSLECGPARGHIEVNTLLPASHPFSTRLRVVGTAGALEASFSQLGDRFETVLTHYPPTGPAESPAIPDEDPYWTECRYFADCVAGRADPARMGAEAARDALLVALAAKESIDRGGECVLVRS